ncbi:hypothetical protein JR316_0001783 [Psilocybe cubensis]|uniref:Uncharacterized protein n=2 Tax=Psilocybe cubensis TaxID=181762 RepID=A0ACB8HAB9_PSICU|nr:hypothetical protein JR316_0001783 [Psilocybe cubensis]KAH9484881.1 hypothetical protein JR316_0001783 [Psilocybe cubensis]
MAAQRRRKGRGRPFIYGLASDPRKIGVTNPAPTPPDGRPPSGRQLMKGVAAETRPSTEEIPQRFDQEEVAVKWGDERDGGGLEKKGVARGDSCSPSRPWIICRRRRSCLNDVYQNFPHRS